MNMYPSDEQGARTTTIYQEIELDMYESGLSLQGLKCWR